MGNDAIGYFFIILLVLIAAPLVFWIASVLYAWVKWLFHDKSKLNASFSEMKDIKNPVTNTLVINYNLGTEGVTKLTICDVRFSPIRELFAEKKEIGNHSFQLETRELKNGAYFLEMITPNQTITKRIIIEN